MINDHTYQGETHISSFVIFLCFFKLFKRVNTELLQFERARYENCLLCWSVLMILFSLYLFEKREKKRPEKKNIFLS